MSGGLEALLDGSLTDAADALASGEVTRLALARAALDRLSRAGRDLNCLIRLDEDEALARAAALDARSEAPACPWRASRSRTRTCSTAPASWPSAGPRSCAATGPP